MEVAEAKRAAANKATAALAGGKHLELNPYHERRVLTEQEAQARAAQRAAGKARRAELWSARQQDDYEDAGERQR